MKLVKIRLESLYKGDIKAQTHLHGRNIGVMLPKAKNYRKLEEGSGADPSLALSEGTWSCRFFDRRPLA